MAVPAPASRLTQNTLSSQASDTAHRLKRAVCQIDTNNPGTGFLITPNCLLTCCHVLPEKEVVQKAYACFSDIQSTASVALNPDPLKNGFYLTSKLEGLGFTAKNLDFALVALSQTVEKVSDLFVLTDQFPPQKEQIHVIQHPVIEVTKRDPDTNRPLEIKQLTGEMRIAIGQVTGFDNYIIHHTAPVAGGSSGAPIVNDAGHLYAFHQAECTNQAHKKCTDPEHAKSKNPVHKDCEILSNCGIGVRTDAVFRYLRDHNIELDDLEELRRCAALKAKYANNGYLELVRPVRGYKDWMLKFPIDAICTELVILRARIKTKEEQNLGNPSFRPDQGLESYETLFMEKESISRDKFFTLLKNSRKLLVLGVAGTGKTTFCQHLAFQWSTGSVLAEYQALFWIRLRHLKESEKLETLFQREFGFTPSDKQLRCALLILDGFDELPPYAEALFRELTTRFQHVIVTSRPKTCIPFQSAIQLEIIGLDKTNSNTYIENYFRALCSQYPEELAKEDFIPKVLRLQTLLLTHPLLASLAHIPVNLSLLCAIFSQEEDFLKDQESITVTALYNYIVNWLYTCFQIRQKELLASIPDSTSDLVSLSNPLSDPAVRNLDHILRGIALNYTQNNTLCASQAKLENLLIHQNSALKINQLNDSGLFKIERGEGEFIHLSYQDFFVARHLVDLYATKQCKEAQAFVKAYKLRERYKWIFWMTAGLLSINYPEILPQYFEDLHTLTPDLGKSYELKLLARCYEECGDLDDLPKYSEFLEAVANYLKEHPSLNAKVELLRDCPKLLTQSAIINTMCDFSFMELKTVIDQIGQQHVPDLILETICSKSKPLRMKWQQNLHLGKWGHRRDALFASRALFTLSKRVTSYQKFSTPCLEFVCSFFKNTLNVDADARNESLAFKIFTVIFEQQKINLGSLEAVLEWLKNLAISPEIQFCLFVEDLIRHRKDPKTRAIFFNYYFIQHSIGEFLGLTAPTPQEMFNRLLTSDSNYSLIVNHYILELIASMLWIESISSALSTAHLVELTIHGNQRAAHALNESLQINCSINDADLTKLIEQFEIEAKSELKDSLAEILSKVVISEHTFSGKILTLLDKSRCIKALVNITNAQKRDSEEAFRLILKNLKYYFSLYQKDLWGKKTLWMVDLLKAPYIERIAEELLSLFNTDQSIDVANALFHLASKGHFCSLETIDRFIQFLKENPKQDKSLLECIVDATLIILNKDVKQRIVDILCNTVKMGHPHLHAILEKVEQELVDEKLHCDLKKSFARVMICAQEPIRRLSLNVIKALVSCIPNSKFKMLTSSLCEIEITEIAEQFWQYPILLFILKQPSTRLSRECLIKLLDDFEKISQLVIQDRINVFSVLNYQDYSLNPWSREPFIQIAYLTGKPFIEAEQG